MQQFTPVSKLSPVAWRVTWRRTVWPGRTVAGSAWIAVMARSVAPFGADVDEGNAHFGGRLKGPDSAFIPAGTGAIGEDVQHLGEGLGGSIRLLIDLFEEAISGFDLRGEGTAGMAQPKAGNALAGQAHRRAPFSVGLGAIEDGDSAAVGDLLEQFQGPASSFVEPGLARDGVFHAVAGIDQEHGVDGTTSSEGHPEAAAGEARPDQGQAQDRDQGHAQKQ